MTVENRGTAIRQSFASSSRRLLQFGVIGGAIVFSGSASAQISGDVLRIGVLDDQSSLYADLSGPGSVTAARMAIEDFGGKILGKPIELLSADHQMKADVGSSVARKWLDVDNVAMITGLGNSSVAIAVQKLVHDKNRINMITSGGTHELTGKYCSPNGVHWTLDTYAMSKVVADAIVKAGSTNWYFLTADYAAGYAMEEVGQKSVQGGGGKVVGTVKHPLNNPDFSSFLLRAQGAKPQVIGLANAGGDTINSIKQAVEFGIPATGVKLASLYFDIVDVKSLGLEVGQGLLFTSSFYWDTNEETRAWTKRFMARHKSAPAQAHAGTYGAVTHYLKAVQAAGTDRADAVMAKMREIPINDFYTKNGRVREDGRAIRDMHLFEVKSPKESKGEWDLMKLVQTVPGNEAYRPIGEGNCAFLAK